MSSLQRSEMRRCGRRYATELEARCSKRVLNGLAVVADRRCHCGAWHLESVKAVVPLRPRKQQRAVPFPEAVAERIDKRDERCQRCSAEDGLEHHHRRGKASGGSRRKHTQCACNGILLCWRCHRWAHVKGRRQAEAEGFIVSQSADKPGALGVMRFAATGGGVTQWPTCKGEWASTASEALEAA